jgi:hypothetical protein
LRQRGAGEQDDRQDGSHRGRSLADRGDAAVVPQLTGRGGVAGGQRGDVSLDQDHASSSCVWEPVSAALSPAASEFSRANGGLP